MKADSSAMRSESKVLALLAKQAKSSRAAAAEFKAANRDDLKKKEEAQLAVLEEYIRLIPTVPDDEIAQAVTKILSTLQANGGKLHYGVGTFHNLLSYLCCSQITVHEQRDSEPSGLNSRLYEKPSVEQC